MSSVLQWLHATSRICLAGEQQCDETIALMSASGCPQRHLVDR